MTRYAYCTPGTRIWWSSIGAWCAAAHRIDRRRCSRQRSAALEAHAAALPRDLIEIEGDPAAIEAAVELLKHGPPELARPPRGTRASAPHTPRIMWLENRAAALRRHADAIPPGANWLAMHNSED